MWTGEGAAHAHPWPSGAESSWRSWRDARDCREECEAIATKVNHFPTRAESAKVIQGHEAELQALQAQREKTDAHLQERQRQFSMLLHSIQELQSVFREDAAKKEAAAAKQAAEAAARATAVHGGMC